VVLTTVTVLPWLAQLHTVGCCNAKSALRQRADVDNETEADVTRDHPVVRLVDPVGVDDLDLAPDAMLAAAPGGRLAFEQAHLRLGTRLNTSMRTSARSEKVPVAPAMTAHPAV
jgi:hypothetical protein